jgi:ribonuclease Z
VISGNTNATESLFEAARDADLVLHDALARHMLDTMIEAATEAGLPAIRQIMTDVLDYHADSRTLEEAASAAGVRQLALYHLVPAPPASVGERIFRRGLSDDTIVVRDLHTFDLPPDSTDIRIQEPQVRGHDGPLHRGGQDRGVRIQHSSRLIRWLRRLQGSRARTPAPAGCAVL